MKPLEKRRKLTGSGLRLLVAQGMALLWLGGLTLTAPAQQGPPGPDTNQPVPSAHEPSAGPDTNAPASPAAEPPGGPGQDQPMGPGHDQQPPEPEPATEAETNVQVAPEQKRVAPAETIRAAVQTPTPSVVVGTNAPAGTNSSVVRDQKSNRDRASRRRTGQEEDSAVGTGTNLMAFKIIYERNIFNPNRGPRYSRRNEADAPKPVKIDGFSLVGTLMSDKGAYAFFDGTEARYQAALQTSNKIAGYTVAAITPNFVTLRSPSNSFDLVMNMQMRKQDEGDWELTVATGSWNSTNSASSTNATVGASDEEGGNDAAADAVMKRLMKKREEELKK